MQDSYSYIIVGAGLSGASAVEGIRERDQRGSILLLGAEKDLPYDRPPLSKQLWTGGKTVAEIVLHDDAFYKNKTGVVYYLNGDRLRGAMMCNVWGQVDTARALIQKAQPVSMETLRGAIH
jgi:NADPH-dependent 2,4-dienoyl-CoA reductase/sulfur reductase-like enzyme